MIVDDLHPRPPGITRVGTGTYLGPDRTRISDKSELSRIAAMAIPPAWTAVWIAPDPLAKIQAIGLDAAGRTQYRYSADWTRQRSGEKFAHVLPFGAALPGLRAHVAGGPRRWAATGSSTWPCACSTWASSGSVRSGTPGTTRRTA